MSKTEFLFLSEEDMLKAGVLNAEHCVDVMIELFGLINQGDYIMGGPSQNEHGLKLFFPKESPFPNMPLAGTDRRFMAMPAYLGGRFHTCGCKWYGSNVANPKSGLPRSILTLMLNNPVTGEPTALLSANLVSSMRTGAVPGVATRFLARKGAKRCAAIGGGPVNRASIKCITSQAKDIEEVIICDINESVAKRFQTYVEKELSLKGTIAKNLEEAVCDSDVIVASVSAAKAVYIPDQWLKQGSLLILNNEVQLDESYLLNSNIVFDNTKMHKAYMDDCHMNPSGALEAYKKYIAGQVYTAMELKKLPPIEQQTSLGDIVADSSLGRSDENQRFVVFTSGMAVEDIAWGYTVYEQAAKMNLGTKLVLWDEPHWS